MLKGTLSYLWLFATAITCAPSNPEIRAAAPSTFSEVTIFTPAANFTDPGTLYARSVLLKDGSLLASKPV